MHGYSFLEWNIGHVQRDRYIESAAAGAAAAAATAVGFLFRFLSMYSFCIV